MPSVFKNTQLVAAQMIAVALGDELTIPGLCTSAYEKEFAKKGSKVGSFVDVRKPPRYLTYKQREYVDQNVQNVTTRVTIDKWYQAPLDFTIEEATLNMDEFKPHAVALARSLASQVNCDLAQFIAQNALNYTGTVGSTPTAHSTYLAGRDKLLKLGLNSRTPIQCVINTTMGSSLVVNTETLHNPPATISSMILSGKIKENILGLQWNSEECLYRHTVGAHGGTPLTNGVPAAATEGNNSTMSLVTDGWTASAAILKAGDRFTLAGVNSVHPESRASTNMPLEFVVLQDATADGSGNATILCAPGITPSGPYKNATAMVADNAAITVIGAASTETTCGLIFPKEAFGFLTVPLEIARDMGPKVTTVTEPTTKISLTLTQSIDPKTMQQINRVDLLCGFAAYYREMGCVVYAA